jgi:hypothetical protein
MVEQSKVRITTEAFEEFLASHREGLYELIDGEIVEKMVTDSGGDVLPDFTMTVAEIFE